MELQSICDQRIFTRGYVNSLASNSIVKQQIIQHTNWLPNDVPLKVRALAIFHNYTKNNFPKCHCGNPVTYEKSYQNSFSQYCSSDCSRKDKRRLDQSTYEKLSDKDWLYQQRITNKLSYEEIADLLSCSVIPVKKACRDLDIPVVRWNQSDSLAKSYLNDKQWLINKHNIEKLKTSEIADLIDSSPATVSRWLQYHGIIANNSNQHQREVNKCSQEEQSLVDYIKSIYNGIILQSDRLILKGKELDIVLPDCKLAFEYNGLYSHVYRPYQSTESSRKGRRYHLEKSLTCQEQGYDLIHIFSDDWLKRTDIVKSIIQSRLGVITTKIHARECDIQYCTKSEKKKFLNDNHIQGNDKSTIDICLKYDDQVVSVMTFCKSRYNNNYQYELSRFCVKNFVHVPGAFSKLLTFFVRQYKPQSIISYCDFSRSNGNLYIKNDFQLVKRNVPSYSYVDMKRCDQRLHRSNFTKSKLQGEGTEEEIMYSNGYHKIFDCGTLVFVKQY